MAASDGNLEAPRLITMAAEPTGPELQALAPNAYVLVQANDEWALYLVGVQNAKRVLNARPIKDVPGLTDLIASKSNISEMNDNDKRTIDAAIKESINLSEPILRFGELVDLQISLPQKMAEFVKRVDAILPRLDDKTRRTVNNYMKSYRAIAQPVLTPNQFDGIAKLSTRDEKIAKYNDIVNEVYSGDKFKQFLEAMKENSLNYVDFEKLLPRLTELEQAAPGASALNIYIPYPFQRIAKYEMVGNDLEKSSSLSAPLVEKFKGIKQIVVDLNEAKRISDRMMTKVVTGKIAEYIENQQELFLDFDAKDKAKWKGFINDFDVLSTEVSKNGDFTPVAFYEMVIKHYTDFYMSHEQGQEDLLVAMRDVMKQTDIYLHNRGGDGILYKTRDNLPGSSSKDEKAFSSMENATPAVREKMVNSVLDNIKQILDSGKHTSHEEKIFDRSMSAITLMGNKTTALWNEMVAKDFPDLVMKDHVALKSETFKWPVTGATLMQIVKANFTGLPSEIKKQIPEEIREKLFNSMAQYDATRFNEPQQKEGVKLALLEMYLSAYLEDRTKERGLTVRGNYLKAVEIFIFNIESTLNTRNQAGIFVAKAADLKISDTKHATAEVIFESVNKLDQGKMDQLVEGMYHAVKATVMDQTKVSSGIAERIYVNAAKVLERIGNKAKQAWQIIAGADKTASPKVKELLTLENPTAKISENASASKFNFFATGKKSSMLSGLFGKSKPKTSVVNTKHIHLEINTDSPSPPNSGGTQPSPKSDYPKSPMSAEPSSAKPGPTIDTTAAEDAPPPPLLSSRMRPGGGSSSP